jgi:hypothetical protein
MLPAWYWGSVSSLRSDKMGSALAKKRKGFERQSTRKIVIAKMIAKKRMDRRFKYHKRK